MEIHLLPAVGEGASADWDALTSSVWKDQVDAQQAARLFAAFGALGPLQSHGPINCTVTASMNTNPQKSGMFAACNATGTYANGEAKVAANMRVEDKKWRVDKINVDSPVLLPFIAAERGLKLVADTPPEEAPVVPPAAPATENGAE